MRDQLDPVVLAAGLAAIIAGGLFAADRGELFDLGPGWIAAFCCAVVGTVLVVSGVSDREC